MLLSMSCGCETDTKCVNGYLHYKDGNAWVMRSGRRKCVPVSPKAAAAYEDENEEEEY